jgi:DNA-directed RNA polymerase sigma subunit (sigma70/sigma32)
MARMSQAEKVARNILRSHGRTKLRRLIEGLQAQESGQAIADDLEVSRERVRQWKNVLTRTVTSVTVEGDVARVLWCGLGPE